MNHSEKLAQTPEVEINFECNDTDIFFSRLKNPVIREQLVGILYEQEMLRYMSVRQETWDLHLPEGRAREPFMKGKNTGQILSSQDLEWRLQEEQPTREKVEQQLDKDIEEAERITHINFENRSSDSSVISLGWTIPWTGKRVSQKQLSIIEAHEKGHVVRKYTSSRFLPAFDLSAVEMSVEDYEMHKKERDNSKIEYADEMQSYEEFTKSYLEDYLFDAAEIAERMSQLKNYFGFKGAEIFTREHLHYAKEHYIHDTDMYNSMKYFFQAITPEKEDVFIELINNSGI